MGAMKRKKMTVAPTELATKWAVVPSGIHYMIYQSDCRNGRAFPTTFFICAQHKAHVFMYTQTQIWAVL